MIFSFKIVKYNTDFLKNPLSDPVCYHHSHSLDNPVYSHHTQSHSLMLMSTVINLKISLDSPVYSHRTQGHPLSGPAYNHLT